jgi:hypothetical protein
MMSATSERPADSGDQSTAGADTVDRTFATGPTCRLSLENSRGRVRVTGWDRPEIHLLAIKRSDASRARYLATTVVTRQDGNAVEIRTILDPSESLADRLGVSGVAAEVIRGFSELIGSQGSTCDVDYDIHVPKQATLSLKGVSSEFAIDGTTGELKVRSVSGSIDTRSVAGPLDLGSVSGEIDTRNVDGPIRVESVSGELRVEGKVAALKAKTVSGEIDVSGPLAPDGSIELGSVSGAATLQLPRATKATISVRGLSGDVHCELPVSVDRNSRGPGSKEWSGRLNGGGSNITFRTVSGGLRVRELPGAATSESTTPPAAETIKSESAAAPVEPAATPAEATTATPMATDAPAPAAASTGAAPSDNDTDAMQILQQLERGEVSVDEALRRIDALRARNA